MNFNGSFPYYTKLIPQNFFEFPERVGQSSILALGLMVLIGIWLESNWKKPKRNLPPGPRSILVSLWKLRYRIWYKNEELQLKTLEEEYGKVICFFGSHFPIVFISDLGTLKIAFNNPALLGRPSQKYAQLFHADHPRGIASTSGARWREIRKFTVTQFKSLGLGNKKLEPAISQQVEECIAVLRTKTNHPFSSKHFFDILTLNVLWQVISSQTFPPGDLQAQNLVKCTERLVSTAHEQALLTRHPKLGSWLLPLLGMDNPFPEMNRQFLQFASGFLNTRLKLSAATSGGEFDDFIQVFIEKIHATTDVNSAFYGQIGYETLQETIRDLFIAGTETTGTALSWALLFLALHPQKQEKLQREIDTVLGNRPPSLHDRPTMKYAEAVINETLRKSSNTPVALPHAAIEDTTIGHFDVPKGTIVFSNLYAIHHCEKTWGDPHSFRPERFLNEDETSLIKHEALNPFGIGKRMCPGAALAYDELFMFITRIFQEFTITWNPAEPKPTMELKFGLSATPLPHTLIIRKRLMSSH